MWPIGLVSNFFYVYIFYSSKFYADMSLQFYYAYISIIGIIKWNERKNNQQVIKIRNITKAEIIKYGLLSAAFFVAYYFVLHYFTDSPLPAWDSLTTSLSIVGSLMLVYKIVQQWYFWIFVNFVSCCLYVYKDLQITSVLFGFYTLMSVYGYFEWRKKLKS